MKKLLLMMITAVLLCSCGGLTFVTAPNSVSLNQGNFKFIKVVRAETQASYVLGIGGLSKRATDDVVELLRQEANLKRNQALADIHIKATTKVWFLGIYITRTLTATATVVEFSNNESIRFLNNGSIETQNEIKETVTIDVVKEKKDSVNVTPPKTEYNKEIVIARLVEINKSLQNGETQNLDSIISEIEDIKKWYESHPAIILGVERELRISKKILKNIR